MLQILPDHTEKVGRMPILKEVASQALYSDGSQGKTSIHTSFLIHRTLNLNLLK